MKPWAAGNYDVSSSIAGLFVYPVKSCAGVALSESVVLDTGLEFDRAWMVVDAQGEFLSQREFPRMALVQPQLKHFEMVLRAPGMLALHVRLSEVHSAARVRVWQDEVRAFDMGDIAAQWFSSFLQTPARLVRFDPEGQRRADAAWTQGREVLTQFSDGFPILVVSSASLALFNSKFQALHGREAEMARFRPNIVLSNAGQALPGSSEALDAMNAHDEDRIEQLDIALGALGGEANRRLELLLCKPCPRCPIPNIDPASAASSPEVGDLLQSYRKDPQLDGAVTFGMNAFALGAPSAASESQASDPVLRVGQAVFGRFKFD